jgi:hypothetical protein
VVSPARYPSLFQLNTRIAMTELTRSLGHAATLDDFPDAELDRLAQLGFEWILLLSVWQTGDAARRISRSDPQWRAEFEHTQPDLREADLAGSGFAINSYIVHRDLGGAQALVRLRTRMRKSGIKIMLDEPFNVTDGTTTLLVDFDVGRSFVMRGNSISQNGLLFKPVIHATTQQNTGTITGSVRADNASGAGIAGATVEVLKAGTPLNDTQSNNVVRTGVTDASGNFTLAFIPAGTYVVRATPTVASGYKPALLTGGAVVTTGNTLSNQVIIVTK